jgi:prepilin-type N-terminal cleavage/methylation domain-containing protein
MTHPRGSRDRGFTLIELVIVVMVIGILATLLMPRYRQSVIKAQGADVATRVEAINVALKEYEADHDSLPTGIEPVGTPSWLAPYLTRDQFTGPSNLTWQYSKTAANVRASLLIAAPNADDAQILVAADGALGSISTLVGNSLIVTMTE